MITEIEINEKLKGLDIFEKCKVLLCLVGKTPKEDLPTELSAIVAEVKVYRYLMGRLPEELCFDVALNRHGSEELCFDVPLNRHGPEEFPPIQSQIFLNKYEPVGKTW